MFGPKEIQETVCFRVGHNEFHYNSEASGQFSKKIFLQT